MSDLTSEERVQQVIDRLMEGHWDDHSGVLLLSAQGTLATHMANIGRKVAALKKEMNVRELNYKQYESERFLEHKKSMTVAEAQAHARTDTFELIGKYIDAKHKHDDWKAVLNAMSNLTVACQVSLKEKREDYTSSQYQ